MDRLSEISKREQEIVSSFSLYLKNSADRTQDEALADPSIRQLINERQALSLESNNIQEEVCEAIGISIDQLDAILEQASPSEEDLYDRSQIITVPSDYDIDALITHAINAVQAELDPEWLLAESQKDYRLHGQYLNSPLVLVGHFRVDMNTEPNAPNRLARSLFLCKDYVDRRDDLDFWRLPIATAEIMGLSRFLDKYSNMGATARHKFDRLSLMDDQLGASTIYELIVGSEAIRHGLSVEMLEESKVTKTPEYRINSLGVPAVIECKRRQVCDYVVSEARHASRLFDVLLPALKSRYAISIDVDFVMDIKEISEEVFCAAILSLIEKQSFQDIVDLGWAQVSLHELPSQIRIPRTRLYSPIFLKEVFDWEFDNQQWDGLVCMVTPPSSIIVEKADIPICMKWRCSNAEAEKKRNRGVANLLSDAIKQVPDGELGIIYISYEEYARDDIADQRTQRILSELNVWKFDRWNTSVPLVIVNRLHPRVLEHGQPDLIDSALYLAAGHVERAFIGNFPLRIFVPPI